jgi:flagellar basal body-associated protein FliL
MKKSIKIIIILFLMLFSQKVLAMPYNNIRMSVVFNGAGGNANVEKIEVHYVTLTNGIKSDGVVVLNEVDKFSTLFSTSTIDELRFSYAIAITKKGERDSYGFVKYNYTVTPNDEYDYIDLSLVATFQSRKYDGEKYRANADITPADIEAIKQGSTDRIVVPAPDGSGITTHTTEKTTTSVTEGTTTESPSEREQRIIHDKKVQQEKEQEERKQKSGKILIIVVISAVVLIIFVAIFTVVKMRNADNRV